ncbi:MAG: TRAP transporter large permease subunit [Dysosmobacter sp.]
MSLKELLDSGADDGKIRSAIAFAIFKKPACHHFSEESQAHDERLCMNQIGGYYRIPVYVTDLFMAVASNKYVFLILINILLLVVGMFMEVGATNLILGPILAPIAAGFGIDPVHFGMLFVYLLALGQATPPFGTTMFVACGISGVSMGRIAKQLLPFIAVEIFCALLFSFVPALSTWIPSMLA